MDFLDAAGELNSLINTYVWYAAIAIILPLGIYFTIRLKGVQITRIPETLRILKKSIKDSLHMEPWPVILLAFRRQVILEL